jgi:hypothetical protein
MCNSICDYDKHDEPIRRRHNGLIMVGSIDTTNRNRIIIHIIKEIVYPTLRTNFPQDGLRTTKEEIYVTDKKHQCKNFDPKNYPVISGFDIVKKEKYSVDKVLDMYIPAVVIEIGGHNNPHLTGYMNLKKLEADIDEVLPSILPDLDYKEVVFDLSRQDRQFSDDQNFDQYTLKILLNF